MDRERRNRVTTTASSSESSVRERWETRLLSAQRERGRTPHPRPRFANEVGGIVVSRPPRSIIDTLQSQGAAGAEPRPRSRGGFPLDREAMKPPQGRVRGQPGWLAERVDARAWETVGGRARPAPDFYPDKPPRRRQLPAKLLRRRPRSPGPPPGTTARH